MVVRGRHPHRARFPLPLRRSRHQSRRHHHQHPDTVGYTVPEEYFALFNMVRERVPNSDKARFRCIATTISAWRWRNSLAGVRAGARQIECTINASANGPATPRWKSRHGHEGAQRQAAVLEPASTPA